MKVTFRLADGPTQQTVADIAKYVADIPMAGEKGALVLIKDGNTIGALAWNQISVLHISAE